MSARTLRGALLGALLVLASSCFSKPQLAPTPYSSYFAGCWTGPVTNYSGLPLLTIVIQPTASDENRLSLTGCYKIAGTRADASFVGSVVSTKSNTVAEVMTTPVNNSIQPPLTFSIWRAPEDSAPATMLRITHMTSSFVADDLQPTCDMTCEQLGIEVTP